MDGESRELRIGAAQIAEVYLDRDATIEKDCEYIRLAGEQNLDLLVFPEYHIPSSPKWYQYDSERGFEEYYRELIEQSVTVPSPPVDRLSEAANDADCVVVVGINFKEEPASGTLYNAQLYIDSDGTVLGLRRKLVPTLYERLIHAGGSGNDIQVFTSAAGTISGMMCGEHLNHLLAFSLMARGQEIHAASWPVYVGYEREALDRIIGIRTRFHAEAAKVPAVLAMGTVTEELAREIGKPELHDNHSYSSVISPTGELLAGPQWEGEGIVYADVDLAERPLHQSHHDLVGHYNRFDIFDLHINAENQNPLTFDGNQK